MSKQLRTKLALAIQTNVLLVRLLLARDGTDSTDDWCEAVAKLGCN
jgi:hypothetical protein